MQSSHSTGGPAFARRASSRLPENVAAALRFWEPRRLTYNLVLAGFVLAWFVGTWPHLRPVMTILGATQLSVLALIANLLYSVAYAAEFVFQAFGLGPRRFHFRSAIWILGAVLAVLLENYWIADEIYPFAR